MGKKVEVIVDLGINYFYHVLSVCNIGYNNDYGIIYKDSISLDQQDTIRKYRKLLSAEEGGNGELSNLIITIPLYLGISSKEELKKYSFLILDSIEKQDITDLEIYYGEELLKLTKWQCYNTENYILSLSEYIDIIRDIFKVFIDGFDTYTENIWPEIQRRLYEETENYNIILEDFDLIRKWEEKTGIIFEETEYKVYLVSSILGGNNIISLGYEKIAICSEQPINNNFELISHQTGTHIMISAFNQVYNQAKYPVNTVHDVYQSVCRFMNFFVLGKMPESVRVSHNDIKIQKILSSLHNESYQTDVADLLERCIVDFLKG